MKWISVQQAYRRLNKAVSLQLLYRMAHSGEIVATKLAGKILIDATSLKGLLESRRRAVLNHQPGIGHALGPRKPTA